MVFKLNVARTGMILVLVPVIFEMVFVVLLAMLLSGAVKSYQELEHDKAAWLSIQRLYAIGLKVVPMLEYGESAHSDSEKARQMEILIPKIRDKNSVMGEFSVEENPELREFFKEIGEVRVVILDIFERGIKAFKTSPAAVQQWRSQTSDAELIGLFMRLRTVTQAFELIESRMLIEKPQEANRWRLELVKYLVFGTILSATISLILILFFSKDIVARLTEIADKAKLIGTGRPLVPSEERDDEIGELDRVICDAGNSLTEAALRESAISDGTADVICALDHKLRIRTVGQSCTRLWQFAQDELLGKSLLSLVASSTVDETRAGFETISKSGNEGKIETTMRLADGSVRQMLWSVSWLPDDRSFYCVVRDITERRNIERLRQHFLSIASHDLRSPLTAVGLSVSMIVGGVKGAVDRQVVDELNKVESNLQGVISLVNEVLLLDKLEGATLALSAVSAADVCESALESLSSLTASYGVRIAGPSGSALLRADEEKVEQALVYLFGSAIKLAGSGSEVKISIESRQSLGFVQVSQSGYALAPHEAELMFDKFRQISKESNNAVKRAGLGPAIARAVAEMHGGCVGVDTIAGVSTLWLSFPLYQEMDGAE